MFVRSLVNRAVSGGRFVSLYESMVNEGKIRKDPRQVAVVNLLQDLGNRLELGGHAPSSTQNSAGSGWRRSWWGGSDPSSQTTPVSPSVRGLYLVGGCGTGKTMLMDLFYSQVEFAKKRRVHFHEYMIDVHSRLHRLQASHAQAKCNTEWTSASAEAQRRALNNGRSDTNAPTSNDLVSRVASELVAESTLLCFDEFQVTFISDAILVRRLFSLLFERGVVVVATSNRPPDDLYLNGLNRELFTPFIPILKNFCIVHNMDSDTDYRQLTRSGDRDKVFFAPLSEHGVREQLESKFFKLANNDIDFETVNVEVQGRKVAVRRAAKKSNIAWFTFKELCDKPLGSADYIGIGKRFHTVFIEGVPKLTLGERDQLRRFITLIDAFYDNHVRLVFSCEASSLPEVFHLDESAKKVSASMDEVFAWDRTVSRLTEMCSVEYQIAHIRRLPIDQFFGQFDLDEKLSEDDLRTIFVRYDKNNDSVIAITGLNRMLNEMATYQGEGSSVRTASRRLLELLTGKPDGKRIKFDAFQKVGGGGILSLLTL